MLKEKIRDCVEKIKKNPRLVIIIVGCIAVIIVAVAIVMITTGNKKENDKEKDNLLTDENIIYNENEKVVEDKVVESTFKLTNTKLSYTDNNSHLETIVENIGMEAKYLNEFNVIFKDKEGNVLVELVGYVGDTLEPGEKRTIDSFCPLDLSTAYAVEYQVVDEQE